MYINSTVTSTPIKINSVMATSTSIEGRRQLSWKKAQTRSNLIFVHADHLREMFIFPYLRHCNLMVNVSDNYL